MNNDPCTPTTPTIRRFRKPDGQRPFWAEEGPDDRSEFRSDRFLPRAERERRARWERENVRMLRRRKRDTGLRSEDNSFYEAAEAAKTKAGGEEPSPVFDSYGLAFLWWALGLVLFYRRPDYFSYWVLGTLGVGYLTRKTPQYLLFSAFFTGLCWYAAYKYNLLP